MSKVVTVDCRYLKPKYAAAFLVVEGNEAAFVEANTAHAVPLLLEALSQEGLKPEQVKYLLITHAHLDHAGGAWRLLEACPNAVLIAHPKTAGHLIDPAKLVESAKQVYGEGTFNELYGELRPIPASRVREVADGEELVFGSRKFRFLHTAGHANHHICILDSQGIFTGDAFGLAYPALQGKGLFIFPSTSPTGFEPQQAKNSVRRIADSGAKTAYLTHFGGIDHLEEAATQLLEHLDFAEDLYQRASAKAERDEDVGSFCEEALFTHFKGVLKTRGLGGDPAALEILDNDLKLNAAGIAFAAGREARKRKEKRK